jgi:hypothetical protein
MTENVTQPPPEESATPADPDADRSLTVTVYLRTATSAAGERRQRRLLEQVDALQEQSEVPAPTVERWSRQVSVPVPDTAPEDAAAIERYEEFCEAAEAADASLEPFFTERPGGTRLLSAETRDRVVVFPVACVAVEAAGDIRGLYPCWRDGIHHSVEDALAALSAGEAPTNLA